MALRALTLLFALLLTGCSSSAGSFALAGAGQGTSGGDGQDGDPNDGEPVPGEPGAGPGGYLGISYWEQPPGKDDEEYSFAVGFYAEFYDDITNGKPSSGGVNWNSPKEPDSCAVTVWDRVDEQSTGGQDGEWAALHAGTLSLSSPGWDVDLEAEWSDGRLQYVFEFHISGHGDVPVYFDSFYEVSATGGSFPAFTSDSALFVPDPIHLISPASADFFEVNGEDLTIEWEGGTEEELWLEFHNGGGLEFNNVQVNCRPLNDGSFTVPGAMLAEFSSQDQLAIQLHQLHSSSFQAGEYIVDVGGSTAAQTLGIAW